MTLTEYQHQLELFTEYLTTDLGFDSVDIPELTISRTGIALTVILKDNFQTELTPGNRIFNGYQTIGPCDSTGELWGVISGLPNRHDRELRTINRIMSQITEHRDDFATEAGRAFADALLAESRKHKHLIGAAHVE